MSTYTFNKNFTPVGLVTSKWSHPIEAFTPHPKHTKVYKQDYTNNIDNTISDIRNNLSSSEVLLAHETTKESAENIIENGFKIEEKGYGPLRNTAVFGWIHKKDIGYFSKKESDIKHTVLFSVPRRKLYVSSYETSARQFLLGEIDANEYKEKHVLKYNDYESIHWNKPEIVRHLNYNPESLI